MIPRWRYRDIARSGRYRGVRAVEKHGPQFLRSDSVKPKFNIPDRPSKLDLTPTSCRRCCGRKRGSRASRSAQSSNYTPIWPPSSYPEPVTPLGRREADRRASFEAAQRLTLIIEPQADVDRYDAMRKVREARPDRGAIIIILRSLKMQGMAQTVGELTEQGSPAFNSVAGPEGGDVRQRSQINALLAQGRSLPEPS